MPTRDRIGDPIEPDDQAGDLDDPKAVIRQLLCDDNCTHDTHDPAAP